MGASPSNLFFMRTLDAISETVTAAFRQFGGDGETDIEILRGKRMTIQKKHRPFIVGIDPGEQTGIAIYSRKRNSILHVCSSDFVRCQKLLKSSFPNPGEVKIFVEHPARFLYDRNAESLHGTIRENVLTKMGGNRREAELLARQLVEIGFDDVELVAPVREKKWTQEKFQLRTGKKTRASQHERDAARLAIYYADKR